jgi:hypothetical protein
VTRLILESVLGVVVGGVVIPLSPPFLYHVNFVRL